MSKGGSGFLSGPVIAASLLLAACGGAAAPAASSGPAAPASKPAASASASGPASAGAGSASAAAKPAAGGDKANLVISYSAPTASQSAPWIAADEGFYDKYGLGKVEVKPIFSGPLGVTALIGGDVDIAVAGGDAIVAARVKGSPVVEIGSFKNYLTGGLVARQGIDKLDQAKKIAVSRIGSNTHYMAVQALTRNGIDPKTVTFIQTGSGANNVAALSTGQVDAASTVPPEELEAEHQGGHLLLNMTALKIGYPAAGIVVTQATLQKKPDAIKRALEAFGAGMHVFFNNPDRAQAIIAKWAKIDDKEALQDGYNSEKQVLEQELTPRPEALAALLTEAAATEPAAKDMKPEQLIDDTILKALVNDGFFKSL
ncbi:MAG TPA: ABC transporter substrate-binding protein [Chloroflexota bacterium]|nr:ABC transporter substrate-binding protein [Chloroflexota bacterium]